MRRWLPLLAFVLVLPPPVLATTFNGSFNGCTDGGSPTTGTSWDTDTDTGGKTECDDADTVRLPATETQIMKALHDDATAEFVEEDTGIATWTEGWLRYYIFIQDGQSYLDANNFVQVRGRNEADSVDVFYIRFLQGTGTGMWRFQASGFTDAAVETLQAQTGGGGFPPNSWTCVEGHWLQDSGVANDGLFEVFVNGNKVAGVYNLDSDTLDYGEVRLGGVTALDAGSALTMWYGDFQTNNTGRIGCETMPPRKFPQDGSS